MMTVADLFNQLKRDVADCGDCQVIIELKEPDGNIIQATFFADRVVDRRDGRNDYVMRMGWPSR